MSVTAGYKVDQRFVFFAVSADTLPTMWSGQPIPIGSDLYLYDVNQQLTWTGSAWVNREDVVEESPVYNPLLTATSEILLQVLLELRCIRLAITKLACDGGGQPSDFDPKFVSSDPEISDQQQI
jgi:hypothetical protein